MKAHPFTVELQKPEDDDLETRLLILMITSAYSKRYNSFQIN